MNYFRDFRQRELYPLTQLFNEYNLSDCYVEAIRSVQPISDMVMTDNINNIVIVKIEGRNLTTTCYDKRQLLQTLRNSPYTCEGVRYLKLSDSMGDHLFSRDIIELLNNSNYRVYYYLQNGTDSCNGIPICYLLYGRSPNVTRLPPTRWQAIELDPIVMEAGSSFFVPRITPFNPYVGLEDRTDLEDLGDFREFLRREYPSQSEIRMNADITNLDNLLL